MGTIFKGFFVKTLKPHYIFINGVAYAGDSWDSHTIEELTASIDDTAEFLYSECNYSTGDEDGVSGCFELVDSSRGDWEIMCRVAIYVKSPQSYLS